MGLYQRSWVGVTFGKMIWTLRELRGRVTFAMNCTGRDLFRTYFILELMFTSPEKILTLKTSKSLNREMILYIAISSF